MSEHHHRHHHHHHHHSIWYRIRRWVRHNKGLAAGGTVIVAAAVLAGGTYLHSSQQAQKKMHVTAGNSVDMKNGYRTRTYDGREYQYNSLITTILYAGIDSEGKMEASTAYSNKARADSIALVIMDKKNQKMSILALNRDTMTQIRRYTREGDDMGLYTSHLGYAYSYGDGGEVSCENLEEAVQLLIGDIPISDYVVTNRSSMPEINRLVGGVTVTVPNNDLAEKYPDLKEGTVVTLDDSNIEDFLRYRDTTKDFSNEGRIARQQTYISAYISQFKQLLQEDLESAWTQSQEMTDHLQTSITKSKYLGLANLLQSVSFTDADYYRPEGTDQLGDLHDEFYVDEDALEKLIIDLFYEPVS